MKMHASLAKFIHNTCYSYFLKNKFQNKNKIILKINYVTKRLSKLAIIN